MATSDMERDLSIRYPSTFQVGHPGRWLSFLRDTYRAGKLQELTSFVVWELLHRSRLLPASTYLTFNAMQPLSLDDEDLADPGFDSKISALFSDPSISVQRMYLNWKQVFIDRDGTIFGCLYPNDTDLYASTDHGKSAEFIHSFPQKIKAIFVSGKGTIFVCVDGCVFRSSDRGTTFSRSLELTSHKSTFRFNNAATETPHGVLIIGEYGNIWDESGWRNLAYLYFSFDDGKTWQKSGFLVGHGINKHVHVVHYSKLLNCLLVADGDNKKKLWVVSSPDESRLQDLTWKPVNRLHIQMGGYTAVVEEKDRLLFGTDYQGGTNFVVETVDGKRFGKRIVPDPYRRSPIDNMIQRRSTHSEEVWANLPYSTSRSKCLLMNTIDGGASWNRLIEYSRSSHTVWLISSSAESSADIYFSIHDVAAGTRVSYRVSNG
jgi:hypothetical protein